MRNRMSIFKSAGEHNVPCLKGRVEIWIERFSIDVNTKTEILAVDFVGASQHEKKFYSVSQMFQLAFSTI